MSVIFFFAARSVQLDASCILWFGAAISGPPTGAERKLPASSEVPRRRNTIRRNFFVIAITTIVHVFVLFIADAALTWRGWRIGVFVCIHGEYPHNSGRNAGALRLHSCPR